MALTPEQIEFIIQTIQGLSLKDALQFLVLKKVVDFSGVGLGKLRQIIRDKQNEGKYAFVPLKEEAQKLLQFSKESAYKKVETLVPHYRYIDIIRTGLLIDFYHRRNQKGDSERVSQIKKSIRSRPNGAKLLKISNLPTTPFFESVLRYVFNLKGKGYSENQLEETFDSIVTDWEAASKFVRNEHTPTDVVTFCETQANIKTSPFFVLGMRSVSKTVEAALDKLKKKKFFKKNGYTPIVTISEEGNHPRMEVTFVKKD